MQTAVGTAQLQKMPAFIEERNHNFEQLYCGLSHLQNDLLLPEHHPLIKTQITVQPTSTPLPSRRFPICWLTTRMRGC